MSSLGKSYERKVYNLNDMLGNVGGIVGILQTIAGIVAYVTVSSIIDTKFVCIYQDPEYTATDEEKAKINRDLNKIKQFPF